MRLLPFDYAARNAGRNPIRTIIMILGSAAVVFLVILMGAFVQSLAATLRSTGDSDNGIILGLGSEDFLEQSEIGASVPSILAASVDSIAKINDKPMISPEILHSAIVTLPRSQSREDSHKILVRGITPSAFQVHQQVYITSGSLPAHGEILVGRLAATRLNLSEYLLEIGKQLHFENQLWTISGTFSAPGTAYDAEIWAPLEELKIQTRRDTYSCIVAKMNRAKDFSDLDLFAKSHLNLELAAVHEMDFYDGMARFFKPVQIMGWIMAGLIVISGLFGGLNVMFAAITGRTKELACLETLGFSRRSILIALLQESFIQVGAGTLLAVVLSITVLSGFAVRFSMGAVELDVTPDVMLVGMITGSVLAVVGTMIPGLRFSRRPLIDQLR